MIRQVKDKVIRIPVIGFLVRYTYKAIRDLLHVWQTIRVLRGLAYCFFHTDHEIQLEDCSKVRLLTDSIREYNCVMDIIGEKSFIQAIMANLNQKDVVYDVGAMLGLHSMFFAKKAREVHAFEPSPANMKRMKENFRHNDIHNIQACRCAVSSEDGRCNFYVESRVAFSGQNSISRDALGSRGSSQITVPILTLDSYACSHHLPTVVKLDIEGAEFEALKGSVSLLGEHEVLFFIELHLKKLSYFGATIDEIVLFLKQNGYELKTIGERVHSKHVCAFPANMSRNLVLT